MQSKINIAKVGEGHQTLIYDTQNKEEVDKITSELTKKTNNFMIYGKLENEAVAISPNQIREFVLDEKFTEKAVVQILGGG